jgi:hypothetical protein
MLLFCPGHHTRSNLITDFNPFLPILQFQSKFVLECANNVFTLRVVTYNIWTQIEDQYVN